MSSPFDWSFPYASRKMPVLAANAVATSQPLAAPGRRGLQVSRGKGGGRPRAPALAQTVREPR
ncbi:MAG: gamma-glutamyltransferase, partial [Achromobacter denitrificans]|nr:gamma-glutamyltransferase [Achromobacter denitrificans]